MPTVLSHPAVPLALGAGLAGTTLTGRLVAAGVLVSVVPDLDVLGLRLGVPYGSPFAHRGFSHSLAFAALLALSGALLHRLWRVGRRTAFLYLFAAAASHGVLDAFTDGGRGVALLWPFTVARYFAPIRPIAVAPLSAARLVSRHGAAVLLSELLYVWLPATLLALVLTAWRKSPLARGPGKGAAPP